MVLAAWDRLFTMSPYEVASLYKGSDDFELIHAILKGGLSRAGNVWHYRVFFEKEHVTKWARSRFFLDRTLHHQVRMGKELSEIKFPTGLASDNVQTAAITWNDFRLSFIKPLERALSLGCDHREIFTSLLAAANLCSTGNQRIYAFLLDLAEDPVLSMNPALACDVLLRKCDATFAANVPGFAKDSASMEWDRLVAREAGSDLQELAKNLVRAYVRKMGDANVDATSVWDHPNMSHDINQRFEAIIRNDKVDTARGLDNATKFGECLAKTRFRVENHELPRSALSCVNLCQRYLSPYEQARASQRPESTTVAAAMPAPNPPKSSTSAKASKSSSTPKDATASLVAG